MPILAGFVKAQSDNLPKIDALSMFAFLRENPDFTGAELRGAKAKRSGRESYGDSAVGYVQVKRENNLCTVKAIVTPEHKISKKGYGVTVTCNEEEEVVLSALCDSCAASLGGCKDAIAFLAWLHRRSEEPSVTEVTCYWKKSKLSTVGKSLKFLKGKDLGKRQVTQLSLKNGSFLSGVLKVSKEMGINDTVLTKYSREINPENQLSIHQLLLDFFQLQQQDSKTATDFLQYCSSQMSEASCDEALRNTKLQHKSKLWYELRYGRITASKAYESAQCQTMHGSLVECILGASSLKDTNAMKRGKKLEHEVRQLVEKKVGFVIEQCGFHTSPERPIMGASPDGLSDEYVFEIKCPTSEKTMKNYIQSDGNIVKMELRKKGCDWLFISHGIVSPEDVIQALENHSGSAVLKFEPFVLHVQCSAVEEAQKLHTASIESGFRNSGMSISKKGKIISAIRSTLSLEVPLSCDGNILVSHEYISYVVDICNQKMKENWLRIERLFSELKTIVTHSKETTEMKLKGKKQLNQKIESKSCDKPNCQVEDHTSSDMFFDGFDHLLNDSSVH